MHVLLVERTKLDYTFHTSKALALSGDVSYLPCNNCLVNGGWWCLFNVWKLLETCVADQVAPLRVVWWPNTKFWHGPCKIWSTRENLNIFSSKQTNKYLPELIWYFTSWMWLISIRWIIFLKWDFCAKCQLSSASKLAAHKNTGSFDCQSHWAPLP